MVLSYSDIYDIIEVERGDFMKFDMSCKVFSIVFTKLLKSYYSKHFPDMAIKDNVKAIKKEYKAMILRTPSLSKDNKMAGNLKGAAYFFAIAKIMPNMTPSLMDEMVTESMKSDFMVKLHKKKKETGALFSEKSQNTMARDAIRSQRSNDEMDWCYTYTKGKDEIKYDITKCGVKRLAEREGLLDYLPCMCHMDYPKYEIQGAKLDRTKTLANGDECCNFHLIRMK